MLLNGGFSPLKGYLCEEDYLCVVQNCRLKNGELWPLPVSLAIPKSMFVREEDVVMAKDINTYIELVSKYDEANVIAIVHVKDIYQPNLEWESLCTLGTTDRNHPYADYLLSNLDVFYVGGNVEQVNGVEHYDFTEYRFTPEQLKTKIKSKGWTRALGFQTRNPMHNCHYSLSKYALSQINITNKETKGLVLQPVVGVTQSGDIDYHVRVRCYKHLLTKYRNENVDVILSLLPLSMRMAGPREAVWHALIRTNYGCTDFVIGRDHAGPSTKTSQGTSFYGSYEAHDMITKFRSDISINIIQSQLLVYSESLKSYTTIAECPDTNYNCLSGTELRRKLSTRENIPEWFTMPEIAKELQSVYSKRKNGICVYLIGLSGAGKTTISRALCERLRERVDEDDITLLDGDVIREHLGQGLGFSKQDRSINVRRIGYVASLVIRAGGIVVCANIAPYDEDRLYNRKMIEDLGGKYVEVYVDTSIDTCEKRDVKGLYKKARNGVIGQFTGISDPFEYPSRSDIIVSGEGDLNAILDRIEKHCFDDLHTM